MKTPCVNCKTGYLIKKDSKIICNNTRCPIHTEGWKKREDIPQCKVDEPQKHIKESGQGVQEADQNIAPNETPLSLKAVGDKLENVFETLNLSGNEQQFEVNVPQQPTQGRGQGVQEEDQKNVSDEINSSLDTAGDGLESNLMEQGEDELNDIVQELMEEYELNDLMEMFPPAVSPEVPERESNIQEEDQFDAPAEIRPQLLGLEGVLTTEVLKRLPESEQESDADKQNEMDTETGTQSLDLLGFSETQYSNEVVPQVIQERNNNLLLSSPTRERSPLSASTSELKEDSPYVESHLPFLKDFNKQEVSLVGDNPRFVVNENPPTKREVGPTRSNPNTAEKSDQVAAQVIQGNNLLLLRPTYKKSRVASSRSGLTIKKCNRARSRALRSIPTTKIINNNNQVRDPRFAKRNVSPKKLQKMHEELKPTESSIKINHVNTPRKFTLPVGVRPILPYIESFCVICEQRLLPEDLIAHLKIHRLKSKIEVFTNNKNQQVNVVMPEASEKSEFSQCPLCVGIFYNNRLGPSIHKCLFRPNLSILNGWRDENYYCLMCQEQFEHLITLGLHNTYSHYDNVNYSVKRIRGIHTLLPKDTSREDLQFCCDLCQVFQFINRRRMKCAKIVDVFLIAPQL